MLKVSPLGSCFAGIATVMVALSAGFAIGARVGSSWGGIERLPAVATNESRPTLAERREIPLVQVVAIESLDERAIVPKAKADRAAAARKDTAERRKIASGTAKECRARRADRRGSGEDAGFHETRGVESEPERRFKPGIRSAS